MGLSNIDIGIVALAAVTLLILIRVPIGLALGGVAIIGLIGVTGVRPMMSLIKSLPFEFSASWELSAIPMFILMGNICFHTGMTTSLFAAARLWLGRLPGGLAVATNFACAAFAAASGSSLATTIAMGRISIPEMRKFNYDPGLMTGVVAAAGTLGSLIPPSILLVIYGIFAETSISALFLAGIVPGLLTAAIYAAMIIIRCRLNPKLAPTLDEHFSLRERFASLIGVWPLPLLIIGVIGSMYAGIATPTEAAAVGVVLSLVIALARRQLTYANLRESLNESIVSSAAIFFIALGAIMMTRLMALSGLPVELAGAMREWAVNPLLLVLATSVLYLVMGCFIDPIGMVLLSLPVLIPMFKEFDLDLVWFGILVVKFVEIGLISPPLGLNVFAVRTLTPDVSLGVVYKGAAWFLFCEIGVVALLIIFPGLTSMFAK